MTDVVASHALSVEQLLSKTTPEKDYTICLDGAVRGRLINAEAELADARRRLTQERELLAALHGERLGTAPAPDARYLGDVVEAERVVDATIAEARLHSLTLHLKGLSSHEYDELISNYGPSDEQIAKAKADAAKAGIANPALPTYDPDEFEPALVAACITNMDMSQEQAKQLKNSSGWNNRDWFDLYSACLDVCAIGGRVDLGKGSKSTNNSKSTSPTASPDTSPIPST